MARLALLTFTLVASAVGTARAQTAGDVRRELAGVDVVERLGAAAPLDLAFTDEAGHPTPLARPVGRPILLTFNYSSCAMLCSLQLAGLALALKELPEGTAPFDVVTVSLDPSEAPVRALRSKQTYARQAGAFPAERWRFLVGREAAIRAVADAVGFSYRYDAATREYRHKATVVVLTPDGRVSSYLHGVSYPPRALAAAVARAARGEVAATRDEGVVGFLLDCFRYDPTSRAPVAMFVMRMVGLAMFLGLGGYIARHLWRENRRRKMLQRA